MSSPRLFQSGHRSRLRERFELATAGGMHAYEVLELLLTFAVMRRDVKPIAKELMARFGTLSGVMDASRAELLAIDGVGPACASLIRLVKEMGTLYLGEALKQGNALTSPRKVADFARMKIGGLPHEAFMIIHLNVQNEVIGTDIVNEGTVDQVAVYPRRIVERALGRHAAGLILVHNHPSGHIQPSEEDKQLTKLVKSTAAALDIRVQDHLVVGRNGYFSFVESGLM
jgi:DNA repair protein RadC